MAWRIKILLSSLMFCLSLAGPAWSEYVSTKTLLDNGLTVVVTEMPTSPKVAVYCLVKTGSATEGEFLGSGISHFLEHMLFKETKKRRVGEIASFIQSVGGTINASTSFDYTIYTIDVPDNEFDNALSIVSDMMNNAVFSQEEFNKERDVIFGEMRLHEDNPDRVLGQMVFSNVYQFHPYKHPIIGYREVFSHLAPSDLEKYYVTRYVPDNMILSIAGNVKTQEILPKIKEAFGGVPRRVIAERALAQEPAQVTFREVKRGFPTDLTRLSMSYAGVRLLDHDLYALDVLANLLGSGRSSRLYNSVLKEKKLVYQISAGNYTPMDRGYFEIEALFEKEKLSQVKEAIIGEIKNIQSQGVSPAELNKAKKRVISSHIFGLESSSGVAYSQALDEAFSGDYKFSQKYVKRIQELKPEDIKTAAVRYLKESALTTSVLEPLEEGMPGEEAASVGNDAPLERIVLPNGITVLFKEDNDLPIIHLRMSLNGGLLQEPLGLEGISQLASTTLVKAIKNKSSEQLSEIIESNGLQVGPFSGKNSFGFSVATLAEDMDLAFDIFKNIALEPAFNDEDIDLAKSMALAALKTRKDNVMTFTNLNVNALLFGGHPYARDLLGTEESVAKITRGDVIGFYKKLANANNMVISVIGNVPKNEVLKRIEKDFAAVSQAKSPLVDWNLLLPSGMDEHESKMKEAQWELNRQQALVMVGLKGPSVDSQDRFAVEVLVDLLGSSFSGRLFQRVREELGKAYSVGGQYVPGIGTGSILLYALTDEGSLPQVKAIILDEMVKMAFSLPDEADVAASKRYLKDTFESDLETNDALSLVASLDELYGLGFDHYATYASHIDAVKLEDIKRVAQVYLNLSTAVVGVTLPQK